MKKFKKGTWVICKWKKSNGGETDIAKVDYPLEGRFLCRRFYRIKGKKVENLSSMIDDNPKIEDDRYAMSWRPMTKAEKNIYFELIASKIY